MAADPPPTRPDDSLAAAIDKACDRFEADWKANLQPQIEAHLADCDPRTAAVLFPELLSLDLAYRERHGQSLDQTEYAQRFPAHTSEVARVFAEYLAWARTNDQLATHAVHVSAGTKSPGCGLHIRCPHCHNPVEIALDAALTDITCGSCGSRISLINDSIETRAAGQVATVGHFELVERLGIGGFGTVWKARDTLLDRTVAVKVPRKGQLSPDELEKFFREARAAAQLHHPNIVSVHEVGRDGETVYIVSDLVRGVSLSNWLSGTSPTAREATEICVRIADALGHAHQAGVVHRDLKPQNILIDAAGSPHLTDFGLAKRETGEITMTLDGQVVGTPAYMSPEQARGEGHEADGRSDIYSLGVILFQLLTGELPFRGNAEMLLHQVLHDEPVAPRRLNRNIPRDLETIALKCLEKDPSGRYHTAGELRDDLQRFLRDEPIRARRAGTAVKLLRWRRRNPAVAALLATVAGVLLLGTFVSSYLAVKLTVSNGQRTRALAEALLGRSALVRQTRPEGYRNEVWDTIGQLQQLHTTVADPTLLRREAVGAMGDFVGLTPVDHAGFDASVTAIALHPAAAFLAVGLDSGEIRLLSPATGKSLGILPGNQGRILALSSTQNDSQLISVAGTPNQPATVFFWERSATGNWQIQRRLALGEAYETARFTRNVDLLVARSDQQAAVWNLAEGRILASCTRDDLLGDSTPLEANDFAITSIALSPNQTLLAIGYETAYERMPGTELVIWDVAQRKVSLRRPLSSGAIYPNGMSFSDDGRFLAVGSDEALVMFDVPSFEQRSLRRLDVIDSVEFTSNSQLLATSDIRGNVTVWSTSTGNEVAKLTHRIQRIGDHCVTFSQDGGYLAACHFDNVRVWLVGGASERRVLDGHANSIPSVTFSPSGDSLATGSADTKIAVWDAVSGTRRFTLDVGSMVQCVAFSPDGGLLAACVWGGHDADVQIWNINSRRLVALAKHSLETIYFVTFVGDKHLAASGAQGIALWELTGNLDRPVDQPITIATQTSMSGSKCLNIAASRDGRFVAWPNDTKQVHVWDWKRSQPVRLNAPRMLHGWHGLAFFPDNSQLAFISGSGSAQQWNFEQGTVRPLTPDQTFQNYHMALSADGKWLAGLSAKDTVVVWNTQTGAEAYAFRPELAAIWSLAWNPDATKLALGLNDGGLVVWDLQLVERQLAGLDLAR